jgi:hypothetical protein
MNENGDVVPDPPQEKTPFGQIPWRLIMVVFVVVGVIAATLSPIAGVAVLVVAAALAGFAWRRLRPPSGTGMGMLSTNCENCGSLLRAQMGLPARTCPSCAHRQSWAK